VLQAPASAPDALPLTTRPTPPQVGAIEGGLEHDAVGDAQLEAHVVLHARRGRGGERDERDGGERLLEQAQLLVVGPASVMEGTRAREGAMFELRRSLRE